MDKQNQNNQGNGNNLPANGGAPAPKAPEKKGLKTLLDGLHRKYDAIRYSKTGKWVARGLTLLTIGGTAKACYDKGFTKGKASVVPTVVTIERIPETAEESTEAPAEEVTAEVTETV